MSTDTNSRESCGRQTHTVGLLASMQHMCKCANVRELCTSHNHFLQVQYKEICLPHQ